MYNVLGKRYFLSASHEYNNMSARIGCDWYGGIGNADDLLEMAPPKTTKMISIVLFIVLFVCIGVLLYEISTLPPRGKILYLIIFPFLRVETNESKIRCCLISRENDIHFIIKIKTYQRNILFI